MWFIPTPSRSPTERSSWWHITTRDAAVYAGGCVTFFTIDQRAVFRSKHVNTSSERGKSLFITSTCTIRELVLYSQPKSIPNSSTVEQLTVNQRVPGSNPGWGANQQTAGIGGLFIFKRLC